MSKMVPEYRDEAKRRIVQAGLEVMYEKGYCRTTMEDIAQHLNVSKPALYRYFKNKNELILESAKILQGEYRRVTTDNSQIQCPVATWINIFDHMMSDNLNEHAVFLEIIGQSMRELSIREHSVERMRIGIEQSADILAKNQANGQVSPDNDPRTLAIALLSMFNGMRMMIVLGVDHTELRSRWREIVITLFRVTGNGIFSSECTSDCSGFETCKNQSFRT